MEKKVDRRIIRSKQGLKAALLELMAQKPFSSITTTEIVRCADFNRGTFYAHYKDKEALLADIMNDLLKDLSEAFRKPYREPEAGDAAVMPAFAAALFEHIHRNAPIYKLMATQNVLPEFREKMLETMQSVSTEELANLVPDSVDQDPQFDIRLFLIYRYHAILGIAFHWIQEDFRQPPQYMADQLIRFLSTQPGRYAVHMESRMPY